MATAILDSFLEKINSGDVPTIAGVLVATTVVAATTFLLFAGKAEVKGKRTVDLGGGSLSKEQVEKGWKQYDEYFKENKGSSGAGVSEKRKAPQFVDTFYNLVTDIYEWGWGQSFHFSPAIKGKSDKETTRIHEERVCDLLKLKPGMKVLDAGCGVGGPMRAIAGKSRANVVGVTINDYQVSRAKSHNKKAKLDDICDVVQGNFLELPFEPNTFDAAYSIEATCHAPRLQDVYAEIFRVLKPGSLYTTYEWVTTNKYDKNNPEHVRIIEEICYGNALPDLRSYEEIVEAAKEVGFEVIDNLDLAAPPALPWWTRLKMGRLAYARNHFLVSLTSWIGIAPKGLVDVHNMLTSVAVSLSEGGDTGIFSPAHMLLLKKPEA